MRLRTELVTLHLREPFCIAHGTSVERQTILVQIGEGRGEGAFPPYYPWTPDEAVAYLDGLDVDHLIGEHPFALETMLDRLPPGPAPARAAVDIALHDLWAHRLGHPLYRLWGLDAPAVPPSSITLSIPASPTELEEHLERLADYPVLKLKLGAPDPQADLDTVRLVRSATSAQVCVDANGAWSVDVAAHLIPALAEHEVLFIEQPVPEGDARLWHALRRRLPEGMPPLIADESVQTETDLLALAGAADGVNIKLTKAGGLRPARRLIVLARALGMKVLIGCMIESSVGISAAAHLAPLADYADLDGNLLVADDPFVGVAIEKGRILLPDTPGIGARPRPSFI